MDIPESRVPYRTRQTNKKEDKQNKKKPTETKTDEQCGPLKM